MKNFCCIFMAVCLLAALCGCTKKSEGSAELLKNTVNATDVDLSVYDFTFTDSELDDGILSSPCTEIGEADSDIVINKAGSYRITGNHTSVTVDAEKNDKVQLILDGATITAQSTPAIYVKQADKCFLTLAEDTINTLTDSDTYSLFDDESNVDAAVFSKSDLAINGKGTIFITGNCKNGITSKDDLVLVDSMITVTAVGNGIEGKDCVKAKNALVTVNAGSNGICSSNNDETNRGYCYFESGSYDVTAEKDGIETETVCVIKDGEFTVVAGNGSANAPIKSGADKPGYFRKEANTSSSSDQTESQKGIKAGKLILIVNGTVTADTADDCVHSNGDTEIDAGTLILASGNDGIHSDNNLIIGGGDITVSNSYEGLEATSITINGGKISVTASDDGLNAAGGKDNSAADNAPRQNPFNSDSTAQISLCGGYLFVNASGDGIDSNGSLFISGGTILVSGPENDGNGALDYNGSATITGGTVIAAGSSGMAQNFDNNSTQCSLLYNMNDRQSDGTFLALTDQEGNILVSFAPEKQYNSVLVSCGAMKTDGIYKLVFGGTAEDSDEHGYCTSGKTTGTISYEINASGTITTVGGNKGMDGGNIGKPNATRPGNAGTAVPPKT